MLTTPHECRCASCSSGNDEAAIQEHRQINAVISVMNDRQRRVYAAAESIRAGYGGVTKLHRITGMSPATIGRGRRELSALLNGIESVENPSRKRGRPRVEHLQPNIEAALEELIADQVAGNPMSDQRWVRSSVRNLRDQLRTQGFAIGHDTVSRLLKKLGYTLRVNIKQRKGFGTESSDRDKQFSYITSQRRYFEGLKLPVISVDAKKKELIGDFKQSGKSWGKQAIIVSQYDFASLAAFKTTPYGIYDTRLNRGFIAVGTSANTPSFAVNSIVSWRSSEGCFQYPAANRILILADGGGCNGYRSRSWKMELQEKVCDELGLTVTVCHYPTRCSKWNPVEHRLFSQISQNWAGRPLRTLEVMLSYIRGTSTRTGLAVSAVLDRRTYETGRKVRQDELQALTITPHDICPDWNYTIQPRQDQPVVQSELSSASC